MKRYWPIFMLSLLIAGGSYVGFVRGKQNSIPQSEIIAVAPPASSFTRATGPITFQFPLDYGPHTDFQTEWWYYTGNLETDNGRHFGFQLTFFRRGLVPDDQMTPRASNWATNQVYSAHFALSDVGGQNYHAFERFARGAAGIAGAQAEPYEVWLEDWVVEQIAENTYHLYAKQDDIVLDLTLEDVQGPVLHGDQGYLQKGPDAGNASYYYSLMRLESAGSVEVGGEKYPVNGSSWMDHEFTTGSLTQDVIGWDWFAIQLDDGSELMLYQGRSSDGGITPFSSGTLVGSDGHITHLTLEDFEIEVKATWKSPHSEGEYPTRWEIRIPAQGLTLHIEPYMTDQEQNLSFTYWEGAVRIEAGRNGERLFGVGYVELTGYGGGALGGRF